ncbi:hypothetical protein [Sporomusa silvacetica]|uniref:hypothetical protein n=1 Tax=Sporomusa silvacetica TaxID=55504 RepID=UPI0011819147
MRQQQQYDYDVEREDGKKHPLNHLNIYYTGKNTFKVGLPQEINNGQIIDLLNLNTECKFLK